jgi:hypothetical protein
MCVLAVGLAVSASALGAAAIHFEPESVSALEGQLHHAQVHALSVHEAAAGGGHIHVSLNDGRHMTVAYAPADQARLVAIAHADGTSVTIAKAKAKKAAKAHHKLRYIAAGILVIVIIVVAAVLLIDRRRKLGEAGEDEPSEGAAAPSAPGETP